MCSSVADIHYNLRGDRQSSVTGPAGDNVTGDNVKISYRYQSLKFQYNLRTGRGAYLLACSDPDDYPYYVSALEKETQTLHKRLHPFAPHLIFVFKSFLARSRELEVFLRQLLAHENRFLESSSQVTPEAAAITKGKLQALHRLFQDLIIRENNNKRDIAIAKCLLRDMKRLKELTESTTGAHEVSWQCHQRIIGKAQYN